ncbi:hypothetical protein ACLVWU_04735 [Bdellovibrio sp. HCB290]|uniref:hypothetical protein n=1 Tax=Bdellovibrio sp. HCB290 TaxID=3394356 RepID=UPI0039B48AF1
MSFVSFVLVTLVSFNVFAGQIPDFLKNPFAATITSTLVTAESSSAFKRATVTLLPSRKSVPLMERAVDFNYSFRLRVNKKAPLVFLIPGTGGTSESAGVLLLAEQLFKMGYHVVTVDNPFSWRFAVAGSKSGLPGYTPRDAADIYGAFKKVAKSLHNDYGIQPQGYSLVGYSLGGLQSLFISEIDQQVKAFGFKKVLIINPPANLLYAVERLDALADVKKQMTAKERQNVSFKVQRVTSAVTSGKISLRDPMQMDKIFKQERFTDLEMSYLIGNEFHDSLGGIIFSTQQVHDAGILKIPATKYKRNARNAEIAKYSFSQYMNVFLLPNLKRGHGNDYTVEQLNFESSIFRFADSIRTNESLYLVTTVDDLFSKPADIAWMQKQFGARAMILPFGGHCGFFQLPAFQNQLKQIF